MYGTDPRIRILTKISRIRSTDQNYYEALATTKTGTKQSPHHNVVCVLQALPDSPESLCLSEMGGTESRDGEVGVQGQLYLNIGLHNGVLLRTVVDQVTGDLSDTRTRQDYS
jgi:hypothetical protein